MWFFGARSGTVGGLRGGVSLLEGAGSGGGMGGGGPSGRRGAAMGVELTA